MHRMWLFFNPGRAVATVCLGLLATALTFHFWLLYTDRYNWLVGPTAIPAQLLQRPAPPGPPHGAEPEGPISDRRAMGGAPASPQNRSEAPNAPAPAPVSPGSQPR